jgi:endoglucanase
VKPSPVPAFLSALLHARSPSGYESQAQAVFDRYVKPSADAYTNDALGNRIATLNPSGDPVLMLAGHMDELGLQISHVNKEGFLYFKTIGGHDRTIISGRRVLIQSAHGPVKGVTGKRAIHLMNDDDRKKVPEIHDIWIDIGAKSKEEALARVALGDPATYDHELEVIHGSIAAARAFDDKVGAYIVGETLLRLAQEKKPLAARVVSVATVQEEVGLRGAGPAARSINPHLGIAVDVGHATDHPDCDHRKFGETKLGGGPILSRGVNTNPFVRERLLQAAKKLKIPVQHSPETSPTGTDANMIQMAHSGVATAIVSVPLRYMHTPSEVADLTDVENCIRLLVEFARNLKPGDHGRW